jgi:hypothetical protein
LRDGSRFGAPGQERAEAVADNLSINVQADLLAAILRLTLPKGIGPFVAKADGTGRHPRRRRRSIRYGAAFDVAEAIDALIGASYSPADVWAMTPRQMAAALYFAGRRRQREAAEKLAMAALAARGEARELKRQLDQLRRD